MPSQSFQSFGIVPAAGSSKRMGTHKLLLPYNGTTLIEHVLTQWNASCVDHTLVVLNRHDNLIIEKCESLDVVCVIPRTMPVEMKHSVQAALEWIQEHMAPNANDAWLLAPADLPGLSHAMIDLVVHSYEQRVPAITVPRHDNRRGHPAMFPWSLREDVYHLDEHQGVNHLFERHPVSDIPVEAAGILDDVDSPEDYRRLQKREHINYPQESS